MIRILFAFSIAFGLFVFTLQELKERNFIECVSGVVLTSWACVFLGWTLRIVYLEHKNGGLK
jgi:hypothetical protein